LAQNRNMEDSAEGLLKKPVREFSFDEIFRRSFYLYHARFIDFLVPFLVVAMVTGTINAVMSFVGFLTYPIPSVRLDLSGFLEFFASITLLATLSWFFLTMASGTAVKYSSDILEKGHARLDESFNFALSRLLSLLGSGIATFMLLMAGTMCLVVPGIIFAIMFSLVVPVIVIEGTGALESLGRSRRLVSKRWGRTFAVLIIIFIIYGIISVIATTVTRPLGFAGSIIVGVASAFVLPLLPIATTFLYYSMIMKENRLVPPKDELTEKPEEPTTLTNHYCSQCGRPISSDANFCQHCGHKIKWSHFSKLI
jgi:hypothetical protein